MLKTINNDYEFANEFIEANRDYFSNLGYQTLFNYLEEINPNYELDVIEIVSEFTEYETFEEVQADYDVASLDELKDLTTVLEVTDYKGTLQSIIIAVF